MGISRVLTLFSRRNLRMWLLIAIVAGLVMAIALAIGKAYQTWDDDPDRGALAIDNGAFGENYSTPIYLDQGWDESDSLWYYNTTQGSALIPYDFFIVLEEANSNELFRATPNIDKFRYLPQKPTFFNPDGLPVGFVKETYQGKDYVGYTCAACHTGQVNYKGKAIRIDGAPAMADMVGFLTSLEHSMKAALNDAAKQQRFVDKVLELNNTYSSADEIKTDLKKWTDTIELYNNVNYSHIEYGYARLDAFGRIYNRVLEHVINKAQVRLVLTGATNAKKQPLLTTAEVDKVLEGISEAVIGDLQFAKIIQRLSSNEPGYPGLTIKQMQRIKHKIFNEPDAPVSYPFLWDITHSDYVQWNGLADNSGVGPLGRNTGEVIGVFGILDWTANDAGFSLSAWITGQEKKTQHIDFKSSIDLVNLSRLESHLKSLTSPLWPTLGTDDQHQQHANQIFSKEPEWQIDVEKAKKGEYLYGEYCQSCHELIDRSDWDRIVVGKMSSLKNVKTDPAMVNNSVNYSGYSGNFNNTYLSEGVGNIVVQNRAPVVQVLTAATKGAVVTPDADKWIIRRVLDWFYMLAHSFFDNEIKSSIKSGNYDPDTTASPYQSLLSYKARSLNGIWATAPYLHNGSVPSLYDLMLPQKRDGDPEDGLYRPNEFMVGSREFDPVKVGFRTQGYDGFLFRTLRVGDLNTGHEYGTIHDPKVMDKTLKPLTDEERWALVEYMKTL
jgi:cytochrome c5